MPGRHNQPVALRLLLPTRRAPSFPDAYVSLVQCKKLKHSVRNRGSVTAANEQVFSDKVMPSSSRRATWSASLMQRWRAGSIRPPAGRATREPLSNRNHSPMARSTLDTLQMQTYARTTARRDDPRNGPLGRRGGPMTTQPSPDTSTTFADEGFGHTRVNGEMGHDRRSPSRRATRRDRSQRFQTGRRDVNAGGCRNQDGWTPSPRPSVASGTSTLPSWILLFTPRCA